MKVLFVSNAYPQDCYNAFLRDSRGMIQIPPNVFQWSIIKGLEMLGIDYTLACVPALPAWPRYKRVFTPNGPFNVENIKRGEYLRYCDLPFLKQLSQRRVLRSFIRGWCELNKDSDCLAVIVYTQQVEMLGAAIDLKRYYPNLVVVPIITDLIENALDFKSNRMILKRIQVKFEEILEKSILPQVDKFILLSKHMIDYMPCACDNYIVIEGVCDVVDNICRNKIPSDGLRTLLYAGTFQEYGGVKLLVRAFMKTIDSRFRLILCGDGVLREFVENSVKMDSRIIYKGKVSHDEVVRLQKESTLLVNPRQPNGGITKYSFPSKTMEYMASGTPMIGYHLEGIPEEYHEHMFSPRDLSLNSLTACINNTLALPQGDLDCKAQGAFKFVSTYKNGVAQVQRIIDFIKS